MKGVAFLALLAAPACCFAQEHDADALAKQLSNPISSLVSVPLQFNFDDGYGLDDEGQRFQLNVQPVIPVALNDHWNMISRTIVPVIEQDDVVPGTGSQFGLGDVTQSLFFSPSTPTAGGWTWGVGPVFYLPTATDDLLGGKKWGVGPTGIALKQTEDHWTVGVLFNHIWSVAGDEDRADISSTFFQPFVSKGIGQGRTISVNLESTYDWKDSQWSVPLNLSYSKVGAIGHQRISWAVGARWWAETPEGGPDWGVRLVLTLLYPKQ